MNNQKQNQQSQQNQQNMGQGQLEDKDILNDLLLTEKHMTSSYDTYANESSCANLRQNLLSILKEEHEIQSQLFNEMNNRGWYPAKQANPADVAAAKQQFNTMKNELS
jgi:spore coat protein F